MSTDMMGYLFPAIFSVIFVSAYYGLFTIIKRRPGLLEVLLGAVPVSIAAIIFESYLFNYLGTAVGLLVVAPILEEVLKFAGTARKRDIGAGLGVGLGFAMTENMLYFHSFLSGYSISSVVSASFIFSQIFLFIIMRGAFDPLLHSTLAGLSVRSWNKGSRFWILVTICFHTAYNLAAIIGMTDIPFLAITDAAILGPALFLLLRKKRARAGMQVITDQPKEAPKSMDLENERAAKQVQVNIENLGIDNFAAWVRSTSRSRGFDGMARIIGLDTTKRYERTQWIRRSQILSNGRRATYTEVGPFGVLLVAGLAALAGVAIWVLFL